MENKIKQIEIKSNSLIALRTAYILIIIVLTGGLIGLMYNISSLNIILLVIGTIIDYLFIIAVFQLTKQINELIKNLGA